MHLFLIFLMPNVANVVSVCKLMTSICFYFLHMLTFVVLYVRVLILHNKSQTVCKYMHTNICTVLLLIPTPSRKISNLSLKQLVV